MGEATHSQTYKGNAYLNDLGITSKRTYAVKRIDSDFFGEE